MQRWQGLGLHGAGLAHLLHSSVQVTVVLLPLHTPAAVSMLPLADTERSLEVKPAAG